MKIDVEYYVPKNEFVIGANGNRHYDSNSYPVKKETIERETQEEIFIEIYNRNNQLRYCNGSYWKFVDKGIENEYYKTFYPKYNTIGHFYGNGVVD